jgi:hypothetical protein
MNLSKSTPIDLTGVLCLAQLCGPVSYLSGVSTSLDGQVRQYRDIGDGVRRRKPKSTTDLKWPQNFELYAVGLRKNKFSAADPHVGESNVMRGASIFCRFAFQTASS